MKKRLKRGTGKTNRTCLVCNKTFSCFIANLKKKNAGKYCGMKCRNKGLLGNKPPHTGLKGYTNGGTFKIGHKQLNTGRTHLTSDRVAKEKNVNWKGGITPMIKLIRGSKEYRLWREAIFKRDNWSCVWCTARSSKGNAVILHADHIKRFSDYPELRFAVDNGRTLCKECHKKTDTYGRKK